MKAASKESSADKYENEVKERVSLWHSELKDLKTKGDFTGLQTLKVAIDTELALAELRIKARQADWAKTMTWGPLIFPTLGAILGAFIGAWLKR